MNLSYNVTQLGRTAIFVDGWNWRSATWEPLQLKVDYVKFLKLLTQNGMLLRAYYYSGKYDDQTIEQIIRVTNPEDAEQRRRELRERQEGEGKFFYWLSRNGFKVITKPIKVYIDAQGKLKLKADLDLELALDMVRLAEHCDREILVSGDGDFVPVVNAVEAKGVRVTVVSTEAREIYEKNGYRASEELVRAADEFIDVIDIKDEIRLEDGNQRG